MLFAPSRDPSAHDRLVALRVPKEHIRALGDEQAPPPLESRLMVIAPGRTFDVWDSDRPGSEEVRRRFRVGVRPGAIVLLHDGDAYDPLGDRSQADALPGIISDAREAGYSFRLVQELLSDEVAEP